MDNNNNLLLLTELKRSKSSIKLKPLEHLATNKFPSLIEKSTEHFINFMINQEPKFANLEKIQEQNVYYLDKKISKVNEYHNEIEKRKAIWHFLSQI